MVSNMNVYKKDLSNIGHTMFEENGNLVILSECKLANIEEILLREILKLFNYKIIDAIDSIIDIDDVNSWDIKFITNMPFNEYMELNVND